MDEIRKRIKHLTPHPHFDRYAKPAPTISEVDLAHWKSLSEETEEWRKKKKEKEKAKPGRQDKG